MRWDIQMDRLDSVLSYRISLQALQQRMVLCAQVTPPHPLQKPTELDIALTEVMFQIELLCAGKEPGPHFRIESIRHSLDTCILGIFANRRELEKIATCDDLDVSLVLVV